MPTFDTAIAGNTGGSAVTAPQTISFTVANNANRYMKVDVEQIAGPTAPDVTVTFHGVALTKRSSIVHSGDNFFYKQYWDLVAPDVGTWNVVITPVASQRLAWIISSIYGVDQTTPRGTIATAEGTNDTPSVVVSSATGEMVVDGIGTSGTRTFTLGGGQSLLAKIETTDSVAGSYEAGASSVTMSWTLDSAAEWLTIAVPLKPSGGSPPPDLKPFWRAGGANRRDILSQVIRRANAFAWGVVSNFLFFDADFTSNAVSGSAAATESGEAAASAGWAALVGGVVTVSAGQAIAVAAIMTISGGITTTESGEAAAQVGAEVFAGTTATTESGENAALAALERFIGTVVTVESGEGSAAAALERFLGSQTTTESGEATAQAGIERFSATTTTTESGEGAALSALEQFIGPVTTVESGEGSAAAALEKFFGSQATVESGEAVNASGDVSGGGGISGDIATTSSGQGSNIAAVEQFNGSQTTTESGEAATSVGNQIFSGGITSTESGETSEGSADEIFSGSQNTTQAGESVSVSGHVEGISGDLVTSSSGERSALLDPRAGTGHAATISQDMDYWAVETMEMHPIDHILDYPQYIIQ